MRCSRVVVACALLACALWAPRPCAAGSSAESNGSRAHETGEHVSLTLEAAADVEVFKPSGYNGSEPTPLLVFLHGFCLPDSGQQEYSFTALRANPNGLLPRQQTLTQVGLRELIDEGNFLYATPTAPHYTRQCALCNIGNDSPNVADRLTVDWLNNTLSRVAPMFYCPAWDGSDACCNGELAGRGDDVQYVVQLIDALAKRYNVDRDRVYALGIATGGFMANRLACEAPGVFAAVVAFAGSTWSDPARCDVPAGEATNLLNIHGTADLTVPVDGGVNHAGVSFPSSDAAVAMFAEKFGCDAESPEVSDAGFTMPSSRGADDVDVATKVYSGCEGGAEVAQWKIDGTDHFMEEPTSRAMFADAVQWMLPKTRAPRT